MFFISHNQKEVIYNQQGLFELERLLTNPIFTEKVVNFIQSPPETGYGPKESIVVNDIHIWRSHGILRIQELLYAWHITVLKQEQVLMLIDQLKKFTDTPYILTFDGNEFKISQYNQDYLDLLKDFYLNKNVYLGVSTSINASCYIFSYNCQGLEPLIDLLLGYSCVLPFYMDQILTALEQADTEFDFLTDNACGFKVIGKNYLRVYSNDYEGTYDLDKDTFLALAKACDSHNHTIGNPRCKEITLILDGPNAILELTE